METDDIIVNKRIDYLDYLKGIGIFLVVVGHTGNSFWGWIYSFHMGLFMWISGYLLASRQVVSLKKFVLKKIKTILLPFVGFWSVSVIIQMYNSQQAGVTLDLSECIKGMLLGGRYLEVTGNFPIWFLQLIFIAEIIFFIEIKYFPKIVIFLTSIIMFFATLRFQEMFPGRPPYHINVLPCALVYLAVGYVSYKLFNEKKYNSTIGILLLVIGWYLQLEYSGNVSQINSYWYYVESICSIMGLYILAKNIKINVKILAKAGRLSLYIMGFHSVLASYANCFVQYINASILIENKFALHMFFAITLFVFSYVVSDVYVTFKEMVMLKYNTHVRVFINCRQKNNNFS